MRISRVFVTCGLIVLLTSSIHGQVNSAPSAPVQAPNVPITTQLKKTVVFLKTRCLVDYTNQVQALNDQALAQMPTPQKVQVLQSLVVMTRNLSGVKVSMSKLTKEESDRVAQLPQLDLNDQAAINAEITWRAGVLLKMTALSEAEVATTTADEQKLLPIQEFSGTGFFIAVPKDPKGGMDGKDFQAVTYIVTNRHVLQPGIEHGKPLVHVDTSITLTRKPDAKHTNSYAETSRTDGILTWKYPADESVDLGVAQINAPQKDYDYAFILTSQFVTDDDIDKKLVVEGDPVMFSGLFVQLDKLQESHTLEPIVRSGSLAMIPYGTVKTTMNDRLGHLYLTEAHAFGGNSGSPMFVDTRKFTNELGYNYKFLGVLSGEVFENADMSLTVTTTLPGQVAANSDVSLVVPAQELMKVLDQPDLKKTRDANFAIAQTQASSPTPAPAAKQ